MHQHHQQHYYHCSPASLTPLSPFSPFWNHQHQLATFARWNILYLGWPSGYLTAGQTGGQTSTGLKDKGFQLKVVSDFFPDSLKESISELLGCMDSMSNGFYVHVMLIMMVWLWTLKSISLHVPSTALFVNERGRYLWLPCRWPRRAGTGFDFHPFENLKVKNAFLLWQLALLMIFVQDEHLNERQGLVIAPTQGFLPTRLRRLVLTLQSFIQIVSHFHSTQSPLSSYCELLIVGFPSKWTIRWCSLVPLPSQLLLVTVIFFYLFCLSLFLIYWQNLKPCLWY